MASPAYALFARAMRERKQVVCLYDGWRRELCPIILGHTDGAEKALTFQFGGETGSRLRPGGDWRCLFLDRVTGVELRDGPFHAGDRHQVRQSCVAEVDLDVNPESPYRPKRRL
jgi:hypothetical protein